MHHIPEFEQYNTVTSSFCFGNGNHWAIGIDSCHSQVKTYSRIYDLRGLVMQHFLLAITDAIVLPPSQGFSCF